MSRRRTYNGEVSPWMGYIQIEGKRIKVCEMQFPFCGCSADNSLHELVKKYLTVENMGVSTDQSPESDEDKRVRVLLKKKQPGEFEADSGPGYYGATTT